MTVTVFDFAPHDVSTKALTVMSKKIGDFLSIIFI